MNGNKNEKKKKKKESAKECKRGEHTNKYEFN
jgi:hypothetical protein